MILTISTFLYKGSPAKAAGDNLNLNAAAAILIDGETGQVLYEDNADELLGVASMSKMLTEYLVLEAIKEGTISWDQEVTISEFIHNLSSPSLGLSTVGLTQGEKYTVKELYETMAIHSANASAVALAELIGGSEANFVKMMNEKAEELGLGDYYFVNSTGLNNADMLGHHPEGTDANDENKMSARAVAKLAFRLINDYPEVLDTASVSRLEFRDGRTYDNFNFMLPGLTFEYEGVDGLKTGSTDYAGYNFTATAERNGQRFISVVMKTGSQIQRFEETKKVLDYAFNSNFENQEIFPAGYTVKGSETLPVLKGKEDSVKIATKDPINLVIKNAEKENYKAKLVIDKDKLNKDGELVAPVKEGDVVGYLTYEYVGEDGKDLGFIDSKGPLKVDVVATETVEKANWFVLMMRGIGGFFSSLWGGITSAIGGLF
ncbi:D-alanyl-D-alanine carboxypeptidase [Caldibacillus lycopersici]|uniref:serine-type D-Ala-D-Ala carboxypeptidase n=1 Tax=Perspicuibacillus lycopersici TaxID=1325689 RepID=A0AAE3IXU7_9BACI|nr:D-alanyl-D-alanine carboxypeptidase [Perspicuibacillus lycopersici]